MGKRKCRCRPLCVSVVRYCKTPAISWRAQEKVKIFATPVARGKLRRILPTHLFTPWCNGNTGDFGSLVHGSNPCGVASALSLSVSGVNAWNLDQSGYSEESSFLPFFSFKLSSNLSSKWPDCRKNLGWPVFVDDPRSSMCTALLPFRRRFCLVLLMAGAAFAGPQAAEPPVPTHAAVSYGDSPHQVMDLYLPSTDGGGVPGFGLVWRYLEAHPECCECGAFSSGAHCGDRGRYPDID